MPEKTRPSSAHHAPNVSEVRAELERVLGSEHFKNTKRSQTLLRFVVEESLEGRADELKERVIGATVFGRPSDYDTTHDSIVRNAANEVRKRLAQYYVEAGQGSNLQIDLPPGSYVPEFVPADAARMPPQPEPASARTRFGRRVAVAALVVVVGGALAAAWFTRKSVPSDSDLFWAPLLDARESVQICVGQPAKLYTVGGRHDDLNRIPAEYDSASDPTSRYTLSDSSILADLRRAPNRFIYLRDALAMTNVVCLLRARGKPYRTRQSGTAPYSELRRSPVVLIGAHNNQWNELLTGNLRFGFGHAIENGKEYKYVTDARKPGLSPWRLELPAGGPSASRDYAIVTRMSNSTTEATLLSLAGINDYGTLAASEFATTPAYLDRALANAPRNWSGNNLQIVLETKIIQGTPGPPSVVAIHVW